MTTRHGHWLAVGLPPDGWVDWRYAPRDNVFAECAADVHAHGGLVVAAHPSVPLPGSLWEFGYAAVDAVEVWNGKWNIDDEMSLRTWLRLLRSGRRITAVGNSDSHGPHQPIGRPHTVVHAEDLSPDGVVAALRRGRCYLAESSGISVSLTASADGGVTAEPGDTLHVPDERTVTVTRTVSGVPDATVALVTDRGCMARVVTDEKDSVV